MVIMRFQKTAKARLELQPGVRVLGQRERALLLLSDGQKTLRDLRPFFDNQLERLVSRLLCEGYLERIAPGHGSSMPVAASIRVLRVESIPEPVTSKLAAEQFVGKRTLATFRML
jgi:hypothetical protein